MKYLKFTLKLTPDNQDYRDILIASLGECGFESFVENEFDIEAFIQEDLSYNGILNNVQFETLFDYTYEIEPIAEQNWNEVWEKNYFKPLLIANQCVIRAPFHTDYPKATYEIVIEPKMAFGTGNHETTSLMIEHILELNIDNKAVLDMGCGTGILAMLACMRNAASVVAIDIDHWSTESTSENASYNNCNNITVKLGDSSLLGDQTFDIIFANIHKNILLEDMAKFASVLNSGGTILLSGFYENDLQDIVDSAVQNKLQVSGHKMRNKWVAAKFMK